MDAEGQPLTLETDLLADRDAWSTADCSVGRALDVVGTRTAMLVLREAYYGTRRFQDFASRVGMTDAATARRLGDLVEQGLLVKAPYRPQGSRTRMEYRLTPKGLDLLPALLALMQWGDRWLAEEGGPLRLTHTACDAPVHVEVRCAQGHEVPGREIRVRASRAGLVAARARTAE
jgi:DNA-binding HxlR family transcriptional regulator